MLPFRSSGRTISWPAYSCQYSGAHVHLGLAPGLEDAALRKIMPDGALASYPARRIPVSEKTSAGGFVDLRLYAVRHADCCSVTLIEPRSEVEGFSRVKLTFCPPPPPTRAASPASPPLNGDDGSKPAAPGDAAPAVVAFLVTTGLSVDDEQNFFETVVMQFLEKSWSSLPTLLREVGCIEPSHQTA